ncbi:MAG: hypothetical protein ACOCYT_02960 [Chloroflexota bacterium]
MPKIPLLFIMLAVLAGCSERGLTPDDLPTRVPSVSAFATSEYLTAVAPPDGMRESVSFPNVDDNLVFLPNWRAEASFSFDGVFARTTRQVDVETSLTVWYNQLGNQRRVVIDGGGELFGDTETPRREAVRLGQDTFLLIDDACLGDADGDAATLADLRLGDIIGGVTFATPAGEQRVLHGRDVWRFSFDTANIQLPLLRLGDEGRITGMQSELWVARVEPDQNVVIRYYVNLEVENVVLRLFDSSLPLTGQLNLRYDLYDIGINPNITQPFGC